MNAPLLGRPRATHKIIDGAFTDHLATLVIDVDRAHREYEDAKSARDNESGGRAAVGSSRGAALAAAVDAAREKAESLAAEHDALQEKATRSYTLMALPKRRWAEAKDAHPPRVEMDPSWTQESGDSPRVNPHPDDEPTGVNVTTFFDAVLRESIVNPDSDPYDPQPLFTEKAVEGFVDALSMKDWRDLCGAIYYLNERGTGIPTSSISSSLRRLIDESSEQPSQSEPPTQDSRRVGSRQSDTSTATETDDPAV